MVGSIVPARASRWRLAAAAALVLVATASAARAAAPTAPSSSAPVRGTDLVIEWKDSWPETYEATVQRWQQDLGGLEARDAGRAQQWADRLVGLLGAILQRAADSQDRPSAWKRVVSDFGRLGADASGRPHLRRLVEEFPGQTHLAAAALHALLDATSDDALAYQAAAREDAEYAAGRLIALREAGLLPEDHAWVVQAWRVRFALAMAERRYWDAGRAIDRLEALAGRDVRWVGDALRLHLAAGRQADAVPLSEELLGLRSSGYTESRHRRVAQEGDPPPDFPRDLGLEMKWSALVSRTSGTDTAAVQALLEESATAQGLMPSQDSRYAGVWVLADRLLSAQAPAVLQPLRQSQARPAEDALARAARSGDLQALFACYRRMPWAAPVHEALVSAGEAMLRRGWSGLAQRTFQDVLSHAADARLRGQAQAGLWLALASGGADAEALAAAFAGVPADATLPWMGERLTAAEIRKRLLVGRTPADAGTAPVLGTLAIDLLRTPPAAAWDLQAFYAAPEEALRAFPTPFGSVQVLDERVLVAGPNLVACYGADPARPLWWRTLREVERVVRRDREGARGRRPNLAAVPGPFEPSLGDGRVYSRWGMDPSGECPRGLAAFDADTGEVLWSTDGDPAWAEMSPIGDPAYADGQVYVLTIQDKFGTFVPVHLVCLDAARGTMLWQRTLGSQNPALPRAESSSSRRDAGPEVVRYGSAVTVTGGAVYAATNLGFVARCDARDGLVEWVAPYPRVHVGTTWGGTFRRQGSPPLVVGGRVLCLPRDAPGLFALDAATGRRLWEEPLLPAEQAIGLVGPLVLVAGGDTVWAVDAAAGRVAWHRRFPAGLRGRPVASGAAVYLATGARLVRLDAATGRLLEARDWDAVDPPRQLAVRDGRALVLSDASAGTGAPAAAPPPTAGPPLAAPLKVGWRLARPDPDVWLPPASARLPGRLYLASRGMLECVAAGAEGGRVLWHRFTPDGVREILWADRTLILSQGRRLVALDGETGLPRWAFDVAPEESLRKVCPPYLVLAAPAPERDGEPMVSLMDLATGRLRWRRPIVHGAGRFTLLDVACDGRHVYAFGEASGQDTPGTLQVTLRVSDGATVSSKAFPAAGAGRLLGLAVGEGGGFCVAEDGSVYEFALGGAATRRTTSVRDLSPRGRLSLRMSGEWLQIRDWGAADASNRPQVVLRRGDPAYELRLDRGGSLWKDALHTLSLRAATVLDLNARKEVTYEIPASGEPGATRGIFDYYATRDRLWVASYVGPGETSAAGGLRMDAFDLATGAHIHGQTIAGTFPDGYRFGWVERRGGGNEDDDHRAAARPPSQIIWTAQGAYVTDPRGLHALVSAGPGETSDSLTTLVALAPRPVAVDGSLEEWDEGDAAALRGDGRRRGRLYLAHDAANLYVAVRYRDAALLTHVGAGDASGGDWLEIGLSTYRSSWRWEVGVDARGRVVWTTLAHGEVPGRSGGAARGEAADPGPRAAVRHDPVAGELVYEAALPWAEWNRSAPEPRRLGLTVAVWDEQPGGGGAARVLSWGGDLATRRLLPGDYQPLYLYPLTRKAAEAMSAIAAELPSLPETFEHFLATSALRADSADALISLCGEYLRRRPEGATADRLLAMDRAVRTRFRMDPTDRLLAPAADARVPEAASRAYARQARAYLSQWIYVAGTQDYPRCITLEVSDGMGRGPAAWDHRVYWLKPHWNSWRPATPLYDRFPMSEWYEIRIPLTVLGMADRPVCGIGYGQQGEPRLVWDRTAVVFDGREEVLLEDALPAGARESGEAWEWVANPVKSGAKAHTQEPPDQRYDVLYRRAEDFRRPAAAHCRPPEGPYLSQWVYVDPSSPPRAVSVALHDGRDWRCHAIWGEKTGRGRYMGPLPPAGTWQELRLPLAWTGLDAEPICGLLFGQDGGRVTWDRTTLVAGGKEHVLLDDDLPPAPERLPRSWQPWVDSHAPGTSPTTGKVGAGLECDGSSGYVEAPHSSDLEPAEFTIEAWVCVRSYAYGSDGRRWLISKNRHEETDGHYALMLNRASVGAYLNVGGTRANLFEAWSRDRTLSLNKWHHAVVTFDAKDLTVYLDGEKAAQTAVNRGRQGGTMPLNIGRRQDAYSYFSGALDEIRLYRRALTAEEVAARFQADGAPPTGDAARAIVAFWGFDADATPTEPEAGWAWVDAPARGGRAHAQAAPADGWTGHACAFKQPALAHLPYAPADALAVLRRHVPALGPSREAASMLDRMLKLAPDEGARLDLNRWFLRAIPDHPDGVELLRRLYYGYRQAGRQDAADAVEADIQGLAIPREVLFTYHRRYPNSSRSYLKSWQVVGPFAALEGRGHETAFPPETEPVNLSAAHDGAGGKVRWQAVESKTGAVGLDRVLGPHEHAVAYAVCWIHVEAAQPAVLEYNRDDTCKIWINRRLVADAGGPTTSSTQSLRVDLPAGWSEVLVKVVNRERSWDFAVELVDWLGRGPPKGLTASVAPPPGTASP